MNWRCGWLEDLSEDSPVCFWKLKHYARNITVHYFDAVRLERNLQLHIVTSTNCQMILPTHLPNSFSSRQISATMPMLVIWQTDTCWGRDTYCRHTLYARRRVDHSLLDEGQGSRLCGINGCGGGHSLFSGKVKPVSRMPHLIALFDLKNNSAFDLPQIGRQRWMITSHHRHLEMIRLADCHKTVVCGVFRVQTSFTARSTSCVTLRWNMGLLQRSFAGTVINAQHL